jgi:hypothetical protein
MGEEGHYKPNQTNVNVDVMDVEKKYKFIDDN